MEYQKSPETAALSAGTGPGIPPPVSAPQTSLRGVFSFQGPENHLVTCLLYREHAVVMDADYLLGKHGEGGDAVPGSRFGEIRTPSDPAALLGHLKIP